MNESSIKDIANQQMPLFTALTGFVNRTNYINIGVITRVHDENYVDVNLYYKSNTGRNVQIQAVRLLHIGTTKCKLLITPAVGDNVLLLCPKDFIETIEYNRIPKKGDNSYLPYGNINMCGILIKDESDDNVKTTISINEDGNISVITEGEVSVENKNDVSVKTTGTLSIQCVDDNDSERASIEINENGGITVNSNDVVEIESQGDLKVDTDGNAKVSATNVVAICSSFSVKASDNSTPAFEVTP